METLSREIPFKGRVTKISLPLDNLSDTIKITPIGDSHLGNRGCDEEELVRWVNIISKDPHHYTFLMGDLCDCILPGDRRFDPQEVAEWLWIPKNRGRIADAQFDRLHSILSIIPSDRILGVIEGNHERTIRDNHHRDLTLDLSRELGIPYLGQEAFIRLSLVFGSKLLGYRDGRTCSISIFATHGSGAGRKPGSKVNKITDLSAFIDSDIYLMGHHHDRLAIRTVQLALDRSANLISKPRLHVLTGTFLKTFASGTAGYGARELYPPTSIGPVTISIHPRSGEMSTVI